MKKTNFLKSVAALVLGCMFTSCEKEELNATFSPKGAEITINAEAFDGLTGKKIDNAQFVADKFQDAINTTKTMNQGESIEATIVTIKAVYNGVESAPVKLEIKALKAGGKAEYNVTLIISDELTFTYKDATIATKSVWAVSEALHNVTHSHDGNNNWFQNVSDYFQPYTFDVTYAPVSKVSEINWVGEKNNAEAVENIRKNWVEKIGETTTFEFSGKASAWSYFNAKATYNVVERTYTVSTKVTEETIATFVITMVADVNVTPDEFAAYGHESHYHGHGHGHGGASNAGGGISIAE